MILNIKKIFFVTCIILVLSFLTSGFNFAFADGANSSKYVLLEPLPCINGFNDCVVGQSTMTSVKLSEYIPYMFTLLISISAVIAVIMIVVGGFQYTTTDSWLGRKEGKTRAMNAVWGLLLVLSTYLILQTVNPKLVSISSTIVPQIEHPSTDAITANFLNQLIGDAEKIRIETNNKKIEAAAAHNLEVETTNKLQDLKDALVEAKKIGDTAKISQLNEQIKVAEDAKNSASIDAALKNGEKAILEAKNMVTGSNSQDSSSILMLDDIKLAMAANDTNYYQAKSRLQALKNSREAISTLTDSYYLTKGDLYLYQQLLSGTRSEKITSTFEADYLSYINSASKKAELKKTYDETIAQINKRDNTTDNLTIPSGF